jgi:hypothetical protein
MMLALPTSNFVVAHPRLLLARLEAILNRPAHPANGEPAGCSLRAGIGQKHAGLTGDRLAELAAILALDADRLSALLGKVAPV